LNARFDDDKRDAVSFVFGDVMSRRSPKPQSSEINHRWARRGALPCAGSLRWHCSTTLQWREMRP